MEPRTDGLVPAGSASRTEGSPRRVISLRVLSRTASLEVPQQRGPALRRLPIARATARTTFTHSAPESARRDRESPRCPWTASAPSRGVVILRSGESSVEECPTPVTVPLAHSRPAREHPAGTVDEHRRGRRCHAIGAALIQQDGQRDPLALRPRLDLRGILLDVDASTAKLRSFCSRYTFSIVEGNSLVQWGHQLA